MDEYRLWSMEYFVEKNKVWFIDFHTNDLYEQDLDSGTLLWINSFPVEGSQFKSHPLCVKWQNDILAFPDFGENVWIYHIAEKEFSKISIGTRKTKRYGSRNPIIQGDDIWIPICGQIDICEPRRILHMNARTHQYEWSSSITENSLCLETVYKDGYIYLASAHGNILYAFNTRDSRCESYHIKELDRGIETICGAGQELWLSDRTGKIVCWDTLLRKTIRTATLPFASAFVKEQKINGAFLQSRYTKGKVCYIPAYTNPLQMYEAVIFDPVSLSFQTMPIIHPEDVNDNYILVEFITGDGRIGMWSEKSSHIFLLDIEYGHVGKMKQVTSKRDSTLLWLRSHPISRETAEQDVSSLLDVIKDERLVPKKKDNLEDNIGTQIYKAICPWDQKGGLQC